MIFCKLLVKSNIYFGIHQHLNWNQCFNFYTDMVWLSTNFSWMNITENVTLSCHFLLSKHCNSSYVGVSPYHVPNEVFSATVVIVNCIATLRLSNMRGTICTLSLIIYTTLIHLVIIISLMIPYYVWHKIMNNEVMKL